ncbi:MAG: helicase associated domain-containing protein [Burkholderiales bacterium]
MNEIGFSWDPFDEKWERGNSALVEYKQINGHCNVPQKWKENPSLGKWVSDQRKKWREKSLKPMYVKRLNKLGFVWQPKKPKR